MSLHSDPAGGVDTEPRGDSSPPRVDRRRALLLVLVPMEVVLLAVSVAVFAGFHRSERSVGQVQQQAAAEAQEILERSPVIANFGMAAHMHDAGASKQVRCAVEAFGTDPLGATDAAQVHVVYAHHLCVIGRAGLAWDGASKSAGPVVVNLDHGSVWIPRPNQDYRTQVQANIPAPYLSQAFGGFADPEAVVQLRRRYTADVGRTN